MGVLNLRYYNTNVLIGLIVFLGFSIGWISNLLISHGHFIGFSTVSAISTILIIIDQYLWKYSFLKPLVWTPNLNGRYEGKIAFFHPADLQQTEKKCVLEITQTASKIKISSYFEKKDKSERTISKSKVETIIKNDDNTFSVVLTYENKGIVGNRHFPPHYGTNILDIIINDEGKFIKGEYYTSREPQTKGIITAKFTSNKLKYNF